MLVLHFIYKTFELYRQNVYFESKLVRIKPDGGGDGKSVQQTGPDLNNNVEKPSE